MITVYSGTNCANCIAAKEQLVAKDIVFEERNIHEDKAAREEILAEGYMSIPVFEKDGIFTDTLTDIL